MKLVMNHYFYNEEKRQIDVQHIEYKDVLFLRVEYQQYNANTTWLFVYRLNEEEGKYEEFYIDITNRGVHDNTEWKVLEK